MKFGIHFRLNLFSWNFVYTFNSTYLAEILYTLSTQPIKLTFCIQSWVEAKAEPKPRQSWSKSWAKAKADPNPKLIQIQN